MRLAALLLLVVGAALGRAQDDVAAHYRPILDLEPFRPKLFRQHAPPAEPRSVTLQVTCIFSVRGGREAFIEERGSGQGAFVRAGRTLGDTEISDVSSSGLVVRRGGKSRAIGLGERVEVMGWPTPVELSKDRTTRSEDSTVK